jgi:uncharacterized repeat protein (TIGR04044 family)
VTSPAPKFGGYPSAIASKPEPTDRAGRFQRGNAGETPGAGPAVAEAPDNLEGDSRMAAITHPLHKEGDYLVDPEEKVFEDVKAAPGEKALVTFHTVPFEGSIGLVNMLQATRLMRKGFETSVLLYGPGVMLGVQRGFPKLGSEAFPGHLVVNQKIGGFMAEGGKVYACRFALSALYGQTEAALIPGIKPINPLDVLDIVLLHRKASAFILNTWTL